MRLLTTMTPIPAGFLAVRLSKALLLSGPVAILVADLSELDAVLGDYAQRLLGVVITPGDGARLERLSPLAWHASLHRNYLSKLSWLMPGWLAAIAAADDAHQHAAAAKFRTGRVARELESTRTDYNVLTSRLRDQVCDLVAAKAELSLLNESLESRVARRTADLASANSQLAQALADLRQTQSELVRAGELAGLGKLVAGVAHELNTPIGNALTISTALADNVRQLKTLYAEGRLKRSALDTFASSAEEITVVLERNLVRAADIISHFKQLAVDQVSEGRRSFRPVDVVSDTMSAISPQLRNTPYRVVLELDSAIEMDSYPGAFSQILTNFFINALTHAFEGRSTGCMIIRLLVCGADSVELVFSDDGNGIAPDNVEHIFEPFFTTKFGQGGSGLGLYIVYNQVHKLLGGRLDFSSQLGQGTSFHVVLPRVAPMHEVVTASS